MAELFRKYVIETRRYNGKFDKWISDNEHIKMGTNYIKFIPTEGEYKGKKMYITLDNIHVVREL